MATVRMMQGDSYALLINLAQNNIPLTPEMVADVEICVGESLRKTLSGGEVFYNDILKQWYFKPTQEDTLSLEPNGYDVIARIKFSPAPDADVKGIKVGQIVIIDTLSEEVI